MGLGDYVLLAGAVCAAGAVALALQPSYLRGLARHAPVALPVAATIRGVRRLGRLVPEGDQFTWVPDRHVQKRVVLPTAVLQELGPGEPLPCQGRARRAFELWVGGKIVVLDVAEPLVPALRDQVRRQAAVPRLLRPVVRLKASGGRAVTIVAAAWTAFIVLVSIPMYTGEDVELRKVGEHPDTGLCDVEWGPVGSGRRQQVDCFELESGAGGAVLGWPISGAGVVTDDTRDMTTGGGLVLGLFLLAPYWLNLAAKPSERVILKPRTHPLAAPPRARAAGPQDEPRLEPPQDDPPGRRP